LNNWQKVFREKTPKLIKKNGIPSISFILTIFFCLIFYFLSSSFSLADQPSLLVHFLDVGYGDAILIQLPSQKVGMIDAGSFQMEKRLEAYLKENHISAVQWAVISHPHENHFGGLGVIIDQFDLQQVFINEDERAEEGYTELLKRLHKSNIPVHTWKKGDRLELGEDITLEVLHPDQLLDTVNGSSLICLLTYKKVAFLFMADADWTDIQDKEVFLSQVKAMEVATVPHHGVGLSPDFVENFRNKIFILSTGENQWGSVAEEQVRQLKGTVYRTDQDGTIVIASDGFTVKRIK